MSHRIDYYRVTRHVARCDVDECPWRQEHRTAADARADGEMHLEAWHPVSQEKDGGPDDERPAVVDLMAALEASLAAVKEGRAK